MPSEMALANVNGASTPPPLDSADASTSATKRKRSVSATQATANGVLVDDKTQSSGPEPKTVERLLKDILEVLRSYDTKPSILDHPLRHDRHRTSSREPSTKRAKLTQSEDATTIAQQVKEGAYTSLQDLVGDVEAASSELLAPLQRKEGYMNGTSQPSLEETRLLTGTLAFRKALKNIVIRETQRKHSSLQGAVTTSSENVDEAKPVSNGEVRIKSPALAAEESQDSRMVLTLYGAGGADGPKQMFSSFQQPVQVKSADATRSTMGLDTSVKITVPLRQSSLPSFLSITEISPVKDSAAAKKKGPTFGELFAPPATIPQLNPPKPAKQLTTRGTTVSWIPHEPIQKPNRKGPYSYPMQPLSTGQWLSYGGVDGSKETTSPTAKQKSRQRALSTGEANPPLSEAAAEALQKAKVDALFRSAYSSFAPTHDDAVAIIPEEVKTRVWWQKVGEKRFQETFAIDPALLADDLAEATLNGESESAGTEPEDEFKDVVDNFVEPEPFTVKSSAEKETEKATDEILKEISEQLETLHSLQRIRNSTLATNGRTPVNQNTALTSMIGTPSSPSAAEIDMYNMLRDMLATTIAALPPFAVAKLNGDQLADLNLSRNLVVETKDYRGAMEEDQVSRLAKQAALSAAVGTPSVPRMGSGSVSGHSHFPPSANQYGRATPTAHAPSARPVQGAQSYYPQQQPPNRSPSMHHQYQRPSSQTYQTPASYPTQTPRQSFPATAAYGPQTPRPAYGQPGSQSYQQRPPTQGYSQYPQYPPSTPQATPQMRGGYQQPSAYSAYQQRPPSVAPMYPYTSSQSPHARTGSPMKPAPQPGQSQPQYGSQQQQRPMYGTPTTAGNTSNATANAQVPRAASTGGGYFPQQQGSQQQQIPQTPGSYGTSGSATPSALGPSGFHTSMTSAEQQLMMDRQRAQLALQPQARMGQAQAVQQQGAAGGESGTPQPQQVNGQQANGTPAAA